MNIHDRCDLRRIPPGVRPAMEQLFGRMLDEVWLVVGDAPTALGARAFAFGHAVFLDADDANLDTAERWGLLGHELAHVLQQCGDRDASVAPVVTCQAGALPVLRDEALEREADHFGERAQALFASRASITARPRVALRDVTAPVLQPVMKLEKFQELTKARTPRALDRISTIDAQLKRFHLLDAAKPRNHVALAAQAKLLHQAARKFLEDKPDANRREPVQKLSQQIAIEGAFLDLLGKYEEETDDMAQFKLLEKAQEFMNRNAAAILEARGGASVDVNDLINKHSMDMKGAGGRDSLLVLRDIEKLKKITADPTLPPILKSVIMEATAAANLQQIDTAVMTPGLKYNKTRGPGTKKYTLNHNMSQNLGRRFRMGSLLHELTHLSNAEIFDNTCLMLSIHKQATDAQVMSLAGARRGLLLALKSEIETSTAVSGDLKSELVGKVGYPIMGKFGSYLSAFKSQLETDPVLYARLKALQQRGLDCELIEYDSVVNQMLLWLHMFGVDSSSGIFTKLEAMAQDAYRHRQSARLMKRALPTPPVRSAVSSPPPRKPLPPLPVRT